ncbi:CYTH domain-containing protein [Actinophytocola sediminis]
MTSPDSPVPGKYARVERERRFLLADLPSDSPATAIRTITDRYLTGTTLRLRHMDDQRGGHQYKFTQKMPAERPGPVQGLITNTYLSKTEYDLLADLPTTTLIKTRYSIPPFGIDVFAPPLHGLVLAEVEFDTDNAMLAFRPPSYVIAEVTNDQRFTGGCLATASREHLTSWLADYGIDVDHRPDPASH